MNQINATHMIATLALCICLGTLTLGATDHDAAQPALSSPEIRQLTEELRKTNELLAAVDKNMTELNAELGQGTKDYSNVLNRIATGMDKNSRSIIELLHELYQK